MYEAQSQFLTRQPQTSARLVLTLCRSPPSPQHSAHKNANGTARWFEWASFVSRWVAYPRHLAFVMLICSMHTIPSEVVANSRVLLSLESSSSSDVYAQPLLTLLRCAWQIQVEKVSKLAFISEVLCIGCGICVKKVRATSFAAIDGSAMVLWICQ